MHNTQRLIIDMLLSKMIKLCLNALLIVCSPVLAFDKSSKRTRGEKTPDEASCLFQANFTRGTLVLDSPGSYRLCEDITFDPNPPKGDLSPAECFDPLDFGEVYNENGFGLGFFAAIAIAADNVDIFLDGYRLEQSKGHALMQRFYANIELNTSPFIAGAGPAQFVGEGDKFRSPSNIRILGPGTIGRASHHGIHGNNNKNVVISGLTFEDFEVAAVSLNNVDNLEISNNHVKRNRQDVPVSGIFSAARFIRPYGAVLRDIGFAMSLRGETVSAKQLYDALVGAINNVYSDVINGNGYIDADAHPDEYELFNNPFKVVDGPCYVFLVHGIGPAVGGQGFAFDSDPERCSSNVVIEKNDIHNMKCWNKEIPAAVVNGVVQNDARGAVLQWVDTVDGKGLALHDDGTYKGNVVADMQIMVAKAIHEKVLTDSDLLQTGVNTLDPSIVAWAESSNATFEPKYRCNGDSMHHVAKGIIVIRVEDTEGFAIEKNRIHDIKSLSVGRFTNCTDFHAGQSPENPDECQVGNVRVISIAATRGYTSNKDCTVSNNQIETVESRSANVVIGIDIQGETKSVDINGNKINLTKKSSDKKRSSSSDEKFFALDKYIGLRVRSNVDGSSVHINKNNKIVQGIANLAPERRLRNKSFRGSPHGEIEWSNGGCPFAKNRGSSNK
eukprot:scaffold38788_cov221-Amphora_coffeaeformis.AAC.2